MIKDKNGCCNYMDLICYQCSGGSYPRMQDKPKGTMEYIREDYISVSSKRSHRYLCKDCGYGATYSTRYVRDYVLQI